MIKTFTVITGLLRRFRKVAFTHLDMSQQQPEVSPILSFQLGFTKQIAKDIQGSEVRHSVSGEADGS